MGQNFSSEPVVDKDTERAENETFKAAVSSCQGWRTSQEDNHSLILELPQSEHKASFFAVYDGHGSDRISKYASEGLWRHLVGNPFYKKGNFKEALEQAFLSFDKEVYESHNAQLAGTTAICVLVVDNVIYCANIGDSRAVASVNCECEPLSYDHKPDNPDELKRILAAGGYVLGNRVNGNLALSRAFGDFHYKSNGNLGPEDQIVSPCPDIKRIELNDDVDFIVLACDGIWDVLTSEEVVNFVISRLEQSMEPGLICEQLTTKCLATDYMLVIGCDNMTVLLVCHTRGRDWSDYCTDIFNKNTKKLGVPRTRSFDPADLDDDPDVHRRRQQQLQQQQAEEEELSQYPNNSGDHVDDFSLQTPRDIRILLDAMQKIHTDDGPICQWGRESRITEIPAFDKVDSSNASCGTDSSSSGKNSIQTPVDKKDDEQDSVLNDSSTEVVSKTTELHLFAPDDDDDNNAEQGNEEKVTEQEKEAKENTDEVEQEGLGEINTVEVELGVPEEDNELPNDSAVAEPEANDADSKEHENESM